MSTETWRAGIQSVIAESGGVLSVEIFDAMAGAELFVRAMAGDDDAMRMFSALAQAVANVRDAPRSKPALCICCPRAVKRVTPRTVFGIVSADSPSASGALGFVYCDRCAADPSTLVSKAAAAFRRICPTLREVSITHPDGGRA